MRRRLAAAAVLVALGAAAATVARRDDGFVYFVPTSVPEGYVVHDARLTRHPAQGLTAGYTPGGSREGLFRNEIELSIARGEQRHAYAAGPFVEFTNECCGHSAMAGGAEAVSFTGLYGNTVLEWMRHDRTRMHVGGLGVSDDEILRVAEAMESLGGITTTIPASALPDGWSAAYQSTRPEPEMRVTQLQFIRADRSPPSVDGSQRSISVIVNTPARSTGWFADDDDHAVTVRGRPGRLLPPAGSSGTLWLTWVENEGVGFTVFAGPDVDVIALAEGLREVGPGEWQAFAGSADRAAESSGYLTVPFEVITFPQESAEQWLQRARALGEFECSSHRDPAEVEVRVPDAQAAVFADRANISEGRRMILCNDKARRLALRMWRLEAASAVRTAVDRIRHALKSLGPD